MITYEYFKPESLEEVWNLCKKFPGSRYIAGGTDLMVQIKNRQIKPKSLISLRSIPELQGIRIKERISIGSMTTITDIIDHQELGNVFPVLIQAAKKIGSTQIRNVGTIGGNLCNCSPCADTALPLLVHDARVILKSPEGSREIFLYEFFLGPGESCLNTNEILKEIILEKPSPNERALFLKKGRVKMDLAIASIAVLVKGDGNFLKKVKIAAGSVAPVPLRLKEAEKILENKTITEEILAVAIESVKKSVSPITDIRSTESYRREIIGVYVKRALQELLGWKQG